MFYDSIYRQNLDLINPLTTCPMGKAKEDCLFTKFHQIPDPKTRIEQINHLSESEIQQLRHHHQTCLQSRTPSKN